MAIYAVGDIHGHLDKLDRALALIEADGGPEAQIVFLGDYVDRGPDSRGVLQRLIDGRDGGKPWRFVRGNHDRMFLNFLNVAEIHDPQIKSGISWLNPRLGGDGTIASYGLSGAAQFLSPGTGGRETLVSYHLKGSSRLGLHELVEHAGEVVPQEHRAFIAQSELFVELGAFLFVHAGIRPGVALSEQNEEDLIWIRDGWLDYTGTLPWLVVHGHTAMEAPVHHGNRVNLDGGAAYGRPLVPAVFDEGRVWTLDEAGRQPLISAG
ncbi:metallophosphoesterase [Palleronia caenipelagi]|uniref:Serine/threonine protein phosphatase n=1 Tax=Palleronia caenipelagi TaxID=2489174 RepID=A0A547Q722_9RHOB|nr:metallophosphoesterase [Palleronia caenipelagi]TRD22182.1 serine/threonine protein phosphatase [Palleronia caenipelagi]